MNNEFDELIKLKECGKRLKELLDISEEDIEKAINEIRQEWK